MSKRRQINVLIDPELLDAIDDYARQLGLSRSAVARAAIRQLLRAGTAWQSGFREGFVAAQARVREALAEVIGQLGAGGIGPTE